ncbi:hypothetical protein Agub_g10080 [Astrephomene gubernaculifera]|uniref:Uncharacterized protein n=1 Tax=Astrephomene gubernaculifera TaxID=47775 RepID=A0AAD3DUA1_9CHLO|nr:hypothetical protein Agub_g10080 [Astrephomene gubernaculifera]
MQRGIRRASTALSSRASIASEAPVTQPAWDSDWAQSELSSYFKQHPEKLTHQLDRIVASLRRSQGSDMQAFIMELDGIIEELNATIDHDRRHVEGRNRLMRDYPEVTNEFLHFFLDSVMEELEREQAAGISAPHAIGSGPSVVRGGSLSAGGAGGALRPGSGSSSSSSAGGKERFASIPRRRHI